ncbi:hypothetical protein SEA_LABELLE_75 [Mycobacterium phage Labelle]|nr:hypothetical protein SEA_LABELLE_75 [Mycobacterium phage Labelle]
MAVSGDLHWERVEAGLYQTMFWANGYKYEIRKDDYYANTWRVYYKWHKDSTKKWRQLTRYGGSFTTLKESKRYAVAHNMHPRRRYKFFGRVTKDNPNIKDHTGVKYVLKRYEGHLMFGEVDKKGQRKSNSLYGYEFISPEKYWLKKKERISLSGQMEQIAKAAKAAQAATERIL